MLSDQLLLEGAHSKYIYIYIYPHSQHKHCKLNKMGQSLKIGIRRPHPNQGHDCCSEDPESPWCARYACASVSSLLKEMKRCHHLYGCRGCHATPLADKASFSSPLPAALLAVKLALLGGATEVATAACTSPGGSPPCGQPW